MRVAGRAQIAAILLGAAMPVGHAEDRALCTRPDILAVAANRLGSTAAHVALIAGTAVEIATARSDVVLCAVAVRVETYDPGAYRDHPAVLAQPRYFTVRRLHDGFEVDFAGR
jgi:hypothetical protein